MKKGVRLAQEYVVRAKPTAHLESYGGGEIIKDDSGTVLSPICAGHNSAWRFAALMLMLGGIFNIETLEVDEEAKDGPPI